ncbi:GlsB/YeaQ/YmgE family stress response membrane protein [Microvirga flavescens]|uniref:GlsB/YeaQ/YmgE family stress response membrane protein n=1 Tax=Microvirga flavescens TaxID=2249811 RepID=UPI000DDBF990|nr:GlsB/YeaQ/YmgE family stress response membrane protein [Microvirga flavescens]
MEGVGFFMMLVIGVIAGWVAERFTKSSHGLLTNMLLGIVGAFVGGFLANLAGIEVSGFWSVLIAAIFGATVLIVVYRAITGRRPSY